MTRRTPSRTETETGTRSGRRRQGRSEDTVSGGRFLFFWVMCLLLFLVWRQDLALPFDLPFQVNAIASRSMEPAYPVGSLAVVTRADQIEVGDVIAFRVPQSAQESYGLPPRLMHRVVEYDVAAGRLKTKGDAVGAPDPFVVDVVWVLGKPQFHVPYLGFVLMFLWSDFGRAWLGFVALLAIYPSLAVRVERLGRRFDRLLSLGGSEGTERRGSHSGPVSSTPAVGGPASGLVDSDRLDAVYQEVRATRTSLQHWEAAMGEYATHLKTHTAILLHLNEATDRLAAAATELAETRRSESTATPSRSTGQEAPHRAAGQTVEAKEPLQVQKQEAPPPTLSLANLLEVELQPESEPMLGKWFGVADGDVWPLQGVI